MCETTNNRQKGENNNDPLKNTPLRPPQGGISDEDLEKSPFEGGAGDVLMDKYEIAYAPSVSMLRFTLNRQASPLNHLFGAANPTKDLAFTDTEVRGIRKQFDSAQILWHDKAIKSAVLEHAGRGNVVHFSCHGSFQYDNPLDSMLILAGGDKDRKKNLTLKEIFANLKLQEAALVTLSACETGMVKLESGDEYIGLPSGFFYAGASAVISSLWAVSDISTSFLMQRLYENIITRNMGRAAALRDAQQYIRDLTVKDIRPIIEALLEDTKKRSSEKGGLISLKLMRGKYKNMPDDEKPFAHPYY